MQNKNVVGLGALAGCGCISMLVILVALGIFAVSTFKFIPQEPMKIHIDMQQPKPKPVECPDGICPICGSRLEEHE